jgi:hypothetical protein
MRTILQLYLYLGDGTIEPISAAAIERTCCKAEVVHMSLITESLCAALSLCDCSALAELMARRSFAGKCLPEPCYIWGQPVLSLAAVHEDDQCLQMLLAAALAENIEAVSLTDSAGFTPLMRAAHRGG